jgi:hypothetical protein
VRKLFAQKRAEARRKKNCFGMPPVPRAKRRPNSLAMAMADVITHNAEKLWQPQTLKFSSRYHRMQMPGIT